MNVETVLYSIYVKIYHHMVFVLLPAAEIPNEFHIKKYEIIAGITPRMRYGRWRPSLLFVRSVIRPITGSVMASQMQEKSATVPYCSVESPSTWVRNGSRYEPKTYGPPPVKALCPP